MKFSPGVWTHKNFRDVYFWVCTVAPDADAEKLRGVWLRRDFGCGELVLGLLGSVYDDLSIPASQFPDWAFVRA